MEDIKTKIKQTKERKKGFLKAMPEEQRQLLKMEERANKTAKFLLWCIPVWFVILLVCFLIFTFKATYDNKWGINGIGAGALFIVGTIIFLLIRSSFKKKAKAAAYSITDYVEEYGEIKQHISDLKKADKDQRAAQKKAEKAEEKARIAYEKSAEQVRLAEEHSKAMQENAQQAMDKANSIINSAPVSAAVAVAEDPIPQTESEPEAVPAPAESEPCDEPSNLPCYDPESLPIEEAEALSAEEPEPLPEADADESPFAESDPAPSDEADPEKEAEAFVSE